MGAAAGGTLKGRAFFVGAGLGPLLSAAPEMNAHGFHPALSTRSSAG